MAGIENEIGIVVGDGCACVGGVDAVFVGTLFPDNSNGITSLELWKVVKRV